MKKVYGSHDSIQIAQLRSLLETSHIACITRNDYLMGAAGELPVMECWPELWVVDNYQHEQARIAHLEQPLKTDGVDQVVEAVGGVHPRGAGNHSPSIEGDTEAARHRDREGPANQRHQQQTQAAEQHRPAAVDRG